MRRLFLTLLFAGLLVVPARTAEQAAAGKSKPAATPEEALEQFTKAAQAGDADAVLNVFAAQPRKILAFAFDATEMVGKAAQKHYDALDAKFGPDPRGKPPFDLSNPKKAMVQHLPKKIDVLSKMPMGDDKVELKVKTTVTDPFTKQDTTHEETLPLIKVGGGWKLMLPANEMEHVAKKDLDKSQAFAKKMVEALEQAAKDVKAGKYATRDEAEKALNAAMPQPGPDILPPGFAGPRPPTPAAPPKKD